MFYELFQNVSAGFDESWQIVYVVAVSFVGIFLFWRSIKRTSTRESKAEGSVGDTADAAGGDVGEGADLVDDQQVTSERVFDIILISFVLALLISRLLFIIFQPEDFVDTRWFLLPYERIEGEVYIMQSFPWLFFRLWDGGILVDGILLGLMISIVLVSRLVKVKWGSIANSVADFLWFWFLAMTFFSMLVHGFSYWRLALIVFLILLGALRFFSYRFRGRGKGTEREKLFEWGFRGVSLVWKLVAILGAAVVMLVISLTTEGVENKEFLVVINIVTIAIGLWLIAGDVVEFLLMLRSAAKDVSIDRVLQRRGKYGVGTSTMARSVGSPVGVGSGSPGTSSPESGARRSFALSYKDFSKGWKDSVAGGARIFSKRLGDLVGKSENRAPEDGVPDNGASVNEVNSGSLGPDAGVANKAGDQIVDER